MSRRLHRDRRNGNIVVLAMILLVGLLGMVAFAIDTGLICVTRQQLQRSADAAAMAACWELIDHNAPFGLTDLAALEVSARSQAGEFALKNQVLMKAPHLDPDDVDVGYLADPSNPASTLVIGGAHPPNAVRVRIRRTTGLNGTVPLFFARALGIFEADAEAEATAALLTDIRGFRIPERGMTVGMLPFALDEDTYEDMINQRGVDEWAWDPVNEQVVRGKDGCDEVNLYPQGTGSPGNRGTVDIGSSNNSTSDIARQITSGVSEGDLSYHGGKLELDESGVLYLNGDTGISAGVKDELASVIGKPRVIPVFRTVTGNGNNATYEIVKFVGIRILDVKLTGSVSKKHVMIQPAAVCTSGTIHTTDSSLSTYVYSPVWLVR
jgi:hypothetical protein